MLFREIKKSFKIYFVITFIFTALSIFSRMAIYEAEGITDTDIETIKLFGQLKFSFLMVFMGAFFLASLSSTLDVLIIKKIIKRRSLGTVLITGILVQSGMITIVLTLMINLYESIIFMLSGRFPVNLEFYDISFVLVHLILAVALSKFVIEIERKLGTGNLWKVLTGRFYKPHVEERIFMFIDMKGSTAIAEKIGHLEFSKLLQDCFREFAITHNYRTEIYQYVGDEVVVSWQLKNGFKNNNFLKAFFAFTAILKSKSDYYQQQFGVRPFFKAGANIGPVVITEVGDVKREIVYHGDTLNTASRIQDMCNNLNAELLIPETLYHQIISPYEYQIDNVGSINLKGKEKKIRLYRVTEL